MVSAGHMEMLILVDANVHPVPLDTWRFDRRTIFKSFTAGSKSKQLTFQFRGAKGLGVSGFKPSASNRSLSRSLGQFLSSGSSRNCLPISLSFLPSPLVHIVMGFDGVDSPHDVLGTGTAGGAAGCN